MQQHALLPNPEVDPRLRGTHSKDTVRTGHYAFPSHGQGC